MKIEYKHKNLVLAFSIIAAAISVGGVLFESIVEQEFVSGSATTFMVLMGMVLLIIGQFSHFENRHTQSLFSFSSYILYLVIYGGYFFKISWGVATENDGNQILRSVNSIFGVFCAISFALLVISLILNSTSRNPNDSIHLLRISGLLLLIFSSLFCLGDIIASTISIDGSNVSIELTESAFSSSMYLVISIIVFLITFFMDKNSYIGAQGKTNFKRGSSYMSEKDKLDTLKRYKELLEKGTITQEEFDSKKKDLI